MSDTTPDAEIKATLRRVQTNLRVTKVVATRSVKGRGGDSYAGFSAAWNTVQDDSGGGIEGIIPDGGESESGMTLREARLAHLLLAMQADMAAHDAALAGGNITAAFHQEATTAIRSNYGRLIRDVFAESHKPESK